MSISPPFESPLTDRPVPKGITVRCGTQDDEFGCFEVMRRSMGYEMSWQHHAPARIHIRNSPGSSFWVAEETPRFSAPKIVGYARSLVRDQVWMLTEFFVVPGHHRRGIGAALLTHCLEGGREYGANTTLVLASQHPSADSLYMRTAGCFPRIPMLLLAGSINTLRLPQSETSIEDERLQRINRGSSDLHPLIYAEPMALTPEVQRSLDALDREIVGYAREQEHRFWSHEMGGPERASRLFRNADGEIIGYGYLGQHNSGPVLARNSGDLPRFVAHLAATLALEPRVEAVLGLPTNTEIYWPVAGTNTEMLSWLLSCGWQIVFQYLFMCSRPMGSLERYVCHNPLYFL
jgi:GNAT superfamily N-acetyltransferase